jgi:aminopeptidase-like protein
VTDILHLIHRLYPICRSITGDGVRDSLQILREHIPLTVFEVPTGTEVLDWTIPKEWNIRDAWIKSPNGEKIADFNENGSSAVTGYVDPDETNKNREHIVVVNW